MYLALDFTVFPQSTRNYAYSYTTYSALALVIDKGPIELDRSHWGLIRDDATCAQKLAPDTQIRKFGGNELSAAKFVLSYSVQKM